MLNAAATGKIRERVVESANKTRLSFEDGMIAQTFFDYWIGRHSTRPMFNRPKLEELVKEAIYFALSKGNFVMPTEMAHRMEIPAAYIRSKCYAVAVEGKVLEVKIA